MNSHRKPGRQLMSITMQADGSILACFAEDGRDGIRFESIYDFFQIDVAGMIATQFDSLEVKLTGSIRQASAKKRSGFKVIPGGKP